MNICSVIDKSSINALALGGFDGLHLGHRELIKRLGENGALLAIEHDRVCLTPDCVRERFCPVPVIIVPLERIMELTPVQFIAELKEEFVNLKRLVVGYDFRFGKDRAAGSKELQTIFDGETIVVSEVSLGGTAVHATRIRSLLLDGNVSGAARLLARPHIIEGKVVRGQGLGSKRLYPTINLSVEKFLAPQDGVYAACTEIGARSYQSVSFVGRRLSADGAFSIETHIIEEGAQIPPIDRVAIWFIDRLRGNRRFEDLDALKEQIAKDVATAKTILTYKENECANL
ncbi:MAG: bifunctional riboflavin kinase/FAD synthetase [Helicobacteraceae bacterium]|nr:bifunctional riboflavin kinase/FAD synthetase [Helicobacteraceae bacterium]